MSECSHVSEPEPLRRHWIALSQGSCDLRVGSDAYLQFGHICKSQVGVPQQMLILLDASVSEDVHTELSCQATSAGFKLIEREIADLPYTLSSVEALSEIFLDAHIVSDDMICAVGTTSTLELAEYAANMWCGGVRFMGLPLSYTSLIAMTTQPEALSCGSAAHMLTITSQADHVLCDTRLLTKDFDDEDARFARVMMVASTMAESQQQFSKLWDEAHDIMQGDFELFCEHLIEAIKLRGRMVASSAISVRQAALYAEAIRHAFLVASKGTMSKSLAYAEALRFSARIACELDQLSVDDCLAQDELLERLDIGWGTATFSADELKCALRDACFSRSHKCMLPLPQVIGRVRMSNLTPELLDEHARAWCDTHTE